MNSEMIDMEKAKRERLRCEYAGLSMAALIGDGEILQSVVRAAETNMQTVEKEVAQQAFDYAAAMIAEYDERGY